MDKKQQQQPKIPVKRVPKSGKNFSGYIDDLSEEQEHALIQFRPIAYDKLKLKNPPYDDDYLLRFLRARKFNLKKTEEMFTNFINWRVTNDVENINQYIYKELPEVRLYYPHGYLKTDKIGRPIYIERIGSLKLQQLFSITTEQRIIRYYIQSYEILLNRIFPACSKAVGKKIDQTLIILDLKGSSMKIMSKQVYNFIKLASSVAQDNYPEIMGKMFIVNAPLLFSGIWTIIKPWLDEKTRSKIEIIGSSYSKRLSEFVDPQNLPQFLGGTTPDELMSKNIGPWNVDGSQPLFPGEIPTQPPKQEKVEEMKQQKTDEEEQQQGNMDQQQLQDLKNALKGLAVSEPQERAPHNPKKYEQQVFNGQVISDTPLNTQIEAEDDQENEIQQQLQYLKAQQQQQDLQEKVSEKLLLQQQQQEKDEKQQQPVQNQQPVEKPQQEEKQQPAEKQQQEEKLKQENN